MKIVILAIATIILCWSCSPYKPVSDEMKKNFTNRFYNDSNKTQSLIEIKGYYQIFDFRKLYYGNDSTRVDSFAHNMLFYSDGTYASSFFFKEGADDDDISNNFNKNLFHYPEGFYPGYWGIYRIEGDTIIVQYINHAGKWIPWVFTENRFKIVDRKSLMLIKTTPLEYIDDYELNAYAGEEKRFSPAYFKKADSIPPPNCWLKEEKWLWKDEGDWVKYMESINRSKKKK